MPPLKMDSSLVLEECLENEIEQSMDDEDSIKQSMDDDDSIKLEELPMHAAAAAAAAGHHGSFKNPSTAATKRGSFVRKPLQRSRTLDESHSTSFGRLDLKDASSGSQDGSNAAPQRIPRRGRKKKKEKRNVRFLDENDGLVDIQLFHPIVVDDIEQMKEFWVVPDELKEIKKQGFLACREAMRSGLAGLLTEIYATNHRTDKEIQDRLNYWCRMASSCRGLERFVNEELSKRRTMYRKRAIVSVLEAQQQLKNEKGIDTANVLRRLSEAYTEQARIYAAKLGAADYHAIESVIHHKTADSTSAATANKNEEEAAEGAKAPSTAAASAAAAADNNKSGDEGDASTAVNNKPRRKSRMERMKERAAATEQKANDQQQNGTDPAFRRNNTTMSAMVKFQQ